MIQVLLLPPEGGPVQQGGIELLDRPGRKWVDVFQPDEQTMALLRGPFGLHRLEVEDCLHLDQRPKLEEYPGHVFIVLQSFRAGTTDICALDMIEMHLFVGADWLLSVHERPSQAISEIWQSATSPDPAMTLDRGADFVAYLIADKLVDANFSVLDLFSDELETIESNVFEQPDATHLQRIFALKRALLTLRRVLSPQRDVVSLLSRPGIQNVSDRTVFYFRDVYDHLMRLHEQIDSSRDLLGNAMEAYLSMVANRTNEITKRLTIFATIFLPLTFITGFFGQNFEILSRPIFFALMMATVVALPLGMLVWFRRLGWL